MPLFDRMVVIPEQEYKDLQKNSGAKFVDSVAGNVDGQVNHFELGENGRVTIKPNGGVTASNVRRKPRVPKRDHDPPAPDGDDDPGGQDRPQEAPIVPDIMSDPPSPSTSLPRPRRRESGSTNGDESDGNGETAIKRLYFDSAAGPDIPMAQYSDMASGPNRPINDRFSSVSTQSNIRPSVSTGVTQTDPTASVSIATQSELPNIASRYSQTDSKVVKSKAAQVKPAGNTVGVQAVMKQASRAAQVQTEEPDFDMTEAGPSLPPTQPIITYPTDDEEEDNERGLSAPVEMLALPTPPPTTPAVEMLALPAPPPADDDAMNRLIREEIARIEGDAVSTSFPKEDSDTDGDFHGFTAEDIGQIKEQQQQQQQQRQQQNIARPSTSKNNSTRLHRQAKKPKRRASLALRATRSAQSPDPSTTLAGLIRNQVAKIDGDQTRVPIMRPTRTKALSRATIKKKRRKKDEQSTGLVVQVPSEEEWENIKDLGEQGDDLRRLVDARLSTLHGKKKKERSMLKVSSGYKGRKERKEKRKRVKKKTVAAPKLGKRKREDDETFDDDEPPTKQKLTVMT